MMARTSRASRPGRSRTRSYSRSSHRTGSVEIFLHPQHHPLVRLLGLIVRLRAELTILTLLIAAHICVWQPLQARIGYWPSVITLVILLGIIVGVPASRRFVGRRWWCVTTRHRMRACFVQTRTMTHHGSLPLLVWSRPSPVGERVRVWLPAGLSVKDLERVTAETAAACWASDVRVTPTRRQAALVVVDVIRRDPLTGGALVPQVVDDLHPTAEPHEFDDRDADDQDLTSTGTDGAGMGTVVPLPSRATLPTPAAPPAATQMDGHVPTTGRSRTRKEPASTGTASPDDPPVTGFGGLDVSDYV